MPAQKGNLRETLASDHALRRKAQEAAALAAYKVIKDAGIVVSPDDITTARQDLDAFFGNAAAKQPGMKDDPANTIAAGAVLVAVLGGF
jgi:hypothetical protein